MSETHTHEGGNEEKSGCEEQVKALKRSRKTGKATFSTKFYTRWCCVITFCTTLSVVVFGSPLITVVWALLLLLVVGLAVCVVPAPALK